MSFNDWLDVVYEIIDNDPVPLEQARIYYDNNKTPLQFAIDLRG